MTDQYQFEKRKLYSYLDDCLLDELKGRKCYIAGGTITSLFCNREINDIDIYFKSKEAFVDFVSAIWEDCGWIIASTTKATLVKYNNSQEIQMIHFRYFPKAEDIFKTFDFTVCMGAFDFETEQFVLHPDFLKHNSQRILIFNSNTAFPIVSLLRVQKYKEKGYTISKPEFLRIALTCMNLRIDTYDDLKEQLGGMYGINYDKLFDDMEGKVDLAEAVSKIENLSLKEEYFKTPNNMGEEIGNLEDFLEDITSIGLPYIELNKKIYRVMGNKLRPSSCKPKNGRKIDANEFFKHKKYYKYVNKHGDKYFSIYDDSFEYKIGEIAVANSNLGAINPVLYFHDLSEVRKSSYQGNNKVLIEAEVVDLEDLVKVGSTTQMKKCRVIREVPESEIFSLEKK